MDVLLLYNPKAGRGIGRRVCEEFESACRKAGHGVQLMRAEAGANPREAMAEETVVGVIGGDGTIHHALPDLAASGAKVYHMPLGTENLFSREFGMDRRPERFLGAIEADRVVEVDLAEANGQMFVLMCSVGPDASVAHRLAARRTGAIRHLSYVRPSIEEFLRPALRPMTVTVDGRCVFEKRKGMVLVANSRQYAVRIDPAKLAEMSDQKLDVVFFPASTSLGLVIRAGLSRLRLHTRLPGVIYETGQIIHIEVEGEPMAYQLDGEAVVDSQAGNAATTPIDIRLRPERLRVLIPAD